MRVSLRFTFGDELGDSVQMIDDRRVPLVGSVFENRDLILHSFTLLMLRAGIMQSKVIAESSRRFACFPIIHSRGGG